MNQTIRSQSFPAITIERTAGEVCDPRARFFRDQHARCRVPGIKVKFPKAIEPTARDIT